MSGARDWEKNPAPCSLFVGALDESPNCYFCKWDFQSHSQEARDAMRTHGELYGMQVYLERRGLDVVCSRVKTGWVVSLFSATRIGHPFPVATSEPQGNIRVAFLQVIEQYDLSLAKMTHPARASSLTH